MNDTGWEELASKTDIGGKEEKSIKSNPKIQTTTFKVKEKGKGFDLIAGMNELKETLSDIILLLNDKELYKQYKVSIPNGMLLYGPPGCGKTFVAQKIS